MEDEKIYHEYTRNIVCPYCGAKDGDSWECLPGEEDLGNIECWECEKTFSAQRIITVEYCTYKIDWLEEWKCYNDNITREREAVRKLRDEGYYKI